MNKKIGYNDVPKSFYIAIMINVLVVANVFVIRSHSIFHKNFLTIRQLIRNT